MTKAVLFGVGETSRLLAQYLQQKDIEIVGAFSRNTGVGEDIGTFFELAEATGHVISNNPATDLARLNADIAILATQSSIQSQLPLIDVCTANGLNVLSLAEEGFYPTAENQESFDRIDRLAKDAGRSVFFGGVQDAFWWGAPLAMSGGSQSITAISCSTYSNVEALGSETVAQYPLNLNVAQFQEFLESSQDDAQLNILAPVMRALLDALRLTPTGVEERLESVIATQDIRCKTLDITISAGNSRGIVETTEIKTAEGPTLTAQFASMVMADSESERIRWRIDGQPNLDMVFDEFPGYEVTAASLINRIPDVIAAEPGYRTVNDLPLNRWQSSSRK